MADIQYNTGPFEWDANLKDVGYTSDTLSSTISGSLIIDGVYIVAGAPAATAGYFAPGCLIQNVVSGLVYRMSGTTAAPAWTALT